MGTPVTITFQDEANATQAIGFDVTTVQRHDLSLTVTENPIERGADVADHATPDLDVVSISFFISNQPIDINADPSGRFEEIKTDIPVYEAPLQPTPGSITRAGTGLVKKGINLLLSGGGANVFTVLRFDDGLNRPRSFYEGFKVLRDNVTLVRVLTSIRDYDDMLVIALSVIRDAGAGDGATFDVTFRQLNLVSTKLGVVQVNPTELRGFKKQALGSKSNKKNSDATQSKSILLLGAQKAGIVS